MEERQLMKELLEEANYDDRMSLDFLRENDLVEYTECTYYVYNYKGGEYIGNDCTDDCYELVGNILEDQDFDEFMECFINTYVEQEDVDKFRKEGLSNKEIAEKLLEKYKS